MQRDKVKLQVSIIYGFLIMSLWIHKPFFIFYPACGIIVKFGLCLMSWKVLVKTAKLWSQWRHNLFPASLPLALPSPDNHPHPTLINACVLYRGLLGCFRLFIETVAIHPPPCVRSSHSCRGRFTVLDLRSSIIITWQRSAILICQGLMAAALAGPIYTSETISLFHRNCF